MRSLCVVALAACAHGATARQPLTLTYTGVAGWRVEGAGKMILADPYFSRPADDTQPLVPDDAAIAARSPAKADLIVVGHSHYDHLLDAPSVAKRTGATIMGSQSTANVARASGVAEDKIHVAKVGEDLELDGFSVRVLASLHSEIGDAILGKSIPEGVVLPMPSSGYAEGGTLAYLVRLGGHEVLILDTANFIEHELEGLRPDVVIVGIGLREKVHDFTCRLVRALGQPKVVIANHFDAWHGPPVDAPVDEDQQAFVEEVRRCDPGARVVVPRHFEPIEVR